MKSQFRHAAIALLATGATAAAQTQAIDDAPEPFGIRFRVAGKVQFNLKATFTDTKPVLANTPGLFEDGYVLPGSNTALDANGNPVAGAVTWNWGYDRADQIPVGSDELTLTRYDNVPRVGSLEGSGGSTAYGGELWAMYELYQFRIWNKRTATWGFEAGYGFTTFDTTAAGTATGTATRNQNIYSLGGIVPPSPGYRGVFSGPAPGGAAAPVIDYAAARTTSTSATGLNTFDGSLSSDIHSIKVGPWVDLPLTDRLGVAFGLGYCAVLAQADLSFRESTTFTGAANPADFAAAVQNLSIDAKRHDWRPGFYAQARLNFMFNENWSAFGGIDLQSNSNLEFSTQGRGAKINLGTVFGATAGVQFSF